MTRDGLFQTRVGSVKAAWNVRADPRLATVFTATYSGLRGEPVTDFVTSIDGVNVRPPAKPYHDPSVDWAHLDLGRYGQTYECVQGQVRAGEGRLCSSRPPPPPRPPL
jgi:hypothetical protein